MKPLSTAGNAEGSEPLAPDLLSIDVERIVVIPGTPTEQRVAEVFAEVLSLPHVAVDANFFVLGGSSLSAMRALSRLNRDFDINLDIRSVYESTTVTAMAATIDRSVLRTRGPAGTGP
jgi:acyl carrier protein